MQNAHVDDESTLRGTKRKAEESDLASQAPKRIKVPCPKKVKADLVLIDVRRLSIKMLLIRLLLAKS